MDSSDYTLRKLAFMYSKYKAEKQEKGEEIESFEEYIDSGLSFIEKYKNADAKKKQLVDMALELSTIRREEEERIKKLDTLIASLPLLK